MTRQIRVLVAEDHLVTRAGLRAIITMQPDMTVVAEALNGQQAVELFRRCQPDVALLDIRLPKMSGVEVAEAIRREFPDARLIALTTYAGAEHVRRAFEAGIRGYLTREVLHEELICTIRAVDAGATYLPPELASTFEAWKLSPHLSHREVEVLELIAGGEANKQIAYSLNIAEATVKNHVKSILTKLSARDRTQAAIAAIRQGIVHF